MANRYGKGDNVERFDSSAGRWQSGLGNYEEMLRKEQAVTEAARSTAGYESQAARSATQAARARAEGADLAERQAIASERSAKAAQLEADAVRRAAQAREQARPLTAPTGRRPLDVLRGAQDPLIAQAYGVGSRIGEIPSQYALRNELGIGSYRARDLRAALGAGSAPAGATPLNVRQAQVAAIEAEQQLTLANRELAALKKRSGSGRAEINEAISAQELAKANVAAARQRIEEARVQAEAHQANVAAIQRETTARTAAAESAAKAAVTTAGGPGSALIPHPQLFGKQVFAENIPPWARANVRGISQPPIQEINPYATGIPGANVQAQGMLGQQAAAAAAMSAQTDQLAAHSEQAAQQQAHAAAAAQTNLQAQGQTAKFATSAMADFEARQIAVAEATSRAAVIQRLYSDEMHRHGALTAEFIQATARGEVTLREFGNEMLLTIGKFAGWTAAATAVYGAFKVISDIKTGAVAAQSAVEGLTRFMPALDRPRAYQGILGLSRHTNVGVQEVGDISQVFARRYNNPQTGLADTLTATRTALLAYKLDQISTADSTRFLMAITQEWQISAQRLPGIFDQISTAQRKFGARVAETLPALARSSSAVKNAGGDINQLIALLALAQVRTGQTGNVVGTAFLRSASNFFRSPKSVATERGFGLNPEEGFTQFLIDAIKRAQTLNGPDRTALAKAIGGPQYGGRIFQSLLNAGPAQVQKFIGGTSPDSTRGAAEKELTHVLGQADQQLQQMGHTLQRIGGYLASSGLLTFAGIMLHGLNDALGALELMVRLFDQLPHGLSTSLALMGEMVVTMRLLSRFGVSQRLQQVPVLGAFVQPGARLRQQALTDQNAVVEANRRQLEADATNALGVRRQQQRYTDRHAEPLRMSTAALEQGISDPKARAAVQQYVIEVQRLEAQMEQAANYAEREVLVGKQRLATEEENLAAIKAANARNIEARLAERNILVSPMRGAVEGGVPTPVTGREFLNQTEARGALINNSAFADRTTARLAASTGPYLAALGLTSRTGARIESGANHIIDGTGRAITSVQRTGRSLAGMGSRLAAFGAALGPLDYALIGIPLTLEAINLMNKAGDDAGRALEQIDRLQTPRSQEQLRANIKTAQARADKGPSFLGRLAGEDPQRPSILGPVLDIGAFIDRHTFAPNAQSPAQVRDQEQQAAQQSADELRRIQQLQSRDKARHGAGGVISNRFASDITRDIDNSANAAKAGILSQQQIEDALHKYQQELQTAYLPTPQDVQSTRAALNRLAGAGKNLKDYASSLRALDDKGLTAAIAATADELQQFGPSTAEGKADLEHLRIGYQVATEKWASGTGPDLKLLAQARAQFLQAAVGAAQSEIQDGLLFARNEGDRAQAYANAQRTLTRQLTTPAHSFTVGGEHGSADVRVGRRPVDDAAAQTLRQQRQTLRDQQYQDQEAGRQVALALTQSRAVNAVRNSRLAVDSARAQVDAARQRYGTESRQYQQAVTSLNQARQQQASAMLAQVQAEGELAQARAGSDPAAQARAAVAAARKALAYIRANANEFDPTQLIQAQTALAQAENQRSEQIRQNALDLIQLRGQIAVARAHGDPIAAAQAALKFARAERSKARNTKERLQATLDLVNANNDLQDAINQREQDRFQYLESLTTDPVKQAGYEVKRTALALSKTHPGTDAYYQAQAQYHQALQQQHSARLSSQEDDIDFQLQMEKITRDEAIKRYQQLARMHNLSKQERRDLLLKIHQLQKDEENDASGFGLRVGNVKLPTVYDVRRAIAAGRRGQDGGNKVNVNNRVNLTVNVNDGGDVAGAFAELDKQIGTSVTGGMRSAGLTV